MQKKDFRKRMLRRKIYSHLSLLYTFSSHQDDDHLLFMNSSRVSTPLDDEKPLFEETFSTSSKVIKADFWGVKAEPIKLSLLREYHFGTQWERMDEWQRNDSRRRGRTNYVITSKWLSWENVCGSCFWFEYEGDRKRWISENLTRENSWTGAGVVLLLDTNRITFRLPTPSPFLFAISVFSRLQKKEGEERDGGERELASENAAGKVWVGNTNEKVCMRKEQRWERKFMEERRKIIIINL